MQTRNPYLTELFAIFIIRIGMNCFLYVVGVITEYVMFQGKKTREAVTVGLCASLLRPV